MRALIAFIKKEFQQLRSDTFMLRFLLLAPFLQLLVLGYSLTLETKNVPLIICDLDNSSVSRRLTSQISQNDRFRIVGTTADFSELERAVLQWDAKIGLYFPPDFSDDLAKNGEGQVLAVLDAVDGNQALTAYGYLMQIIAEEGLELAPRHIRENFLGEAMLMEQNVRYWYNPELKNEAFMVPGIVILIIMIITLLMGSMGIVREKETGTLEQIMVTPIRKIHLVLGKIFPFLLYSLLELAVMLKVAQWVFRIQMAGSLLQLYLSLLIFLFSTLGLGLFVSTISRTQQQALFIAWFFMIFMVLLSGFFIPIANMPLWLRHVTHLNPLRYMMEITRGIYLKGTPMKYQLKQILPMAALGIALFGFGVLRFSKTAD